MTSIHPYWQSEAARWQFIDQQIAAAWPSGAGTRETLTDRDISPQRLWSRFIDQLNIVAAAGGKSASQLPFHFVSDVARWSLVGIEMTDKLEPGAVTTPPAYTFQRVDEVTPLFTKTDLLGALNTKGPYVYGKPINVKTDPMYAGLVDYLVYYSSDHDISATPNGYISLIACGAGLDPRQYASWKLYNDAKAAGWFANVTGTVPAASPLFQYSTSRQNETFGVHQIGSTWFATYQVAGSAGLPQGQLSLRATSTNGLSWTANATPFLLPPPNEIGSNPADPTNHTGYARLHKNDWLPSVPFSWFGYSLIGGGSESQSGMWGTNDPIGDNAWTYLGPAGGQQGRATDTAPAPGTYGPYEAAFPVSLRQTPQGVAALCNAATSSFFTAASTGGVFEYLLSADGKTAISDIRLCLPKSSTSGSYAEGRTSIAGVVEETDYFWAIEVGQNAAGTASAMGIVWSPKAGAPNATFNLLTPAIPDGRTIYDANYKSLSAVPAHFTELKYGSVAPVTTFDATGLQVVFDGAAAPNKGAYYQFGDGFVPDNMEYIDIYVDDFRSLVTNSRHFALGFSQANNENATTADGIFVESSPSGANNRLFKSLVVGGVAQPRVQLDTPGPGFGSLASETTIGINFSKYDKFYGLRWFVKQGRMVVLGQGGVEIADFSIAFASHLDPAATYYPFIALRGIAASSTERFGSFGYSFKAGSGKIVEPFTPYAFVPLVDLNYAQNVFKIGNDVFASLAAFEADSRVTKDATGTLYQHMVNLPATYTTGAVQVLHTVQRPGSGTRYIAMLDDGNDGNATDELTRIGLIGTGEIQCMTNAGGTATLTTAGSGAIKTNGQRCNSIFSFGSGLMTTNELASGTGDFTGTNTAGVNRLVVGGRPDSATLKYGGTIHRVIVYPDRMNNNACLALGSMT